MLKSIGVDAVYCDGDIETNQNGVTVRHRQALTTPDGKVFVSSNATLSSEHIAYHENVHVNDNLGTKAYSDYESIICDNLLYNSDSYKSVAGQINENHYGGKYDIENLDNAKKFIREIAAYVNEFVMTEPQLAEQIFGEMFEDWNAVVAAVKQFNTDTKADFSGSASFMPETGVTNTTESENSGENPLYHSTETTIDTTAKRVIEDAAISKGSITDKQVQKIRAFGRKNGVKINFANLTVKNSEGQVIFNPNGKTNPDGSITINVNAEDPVGFVVRHELTHIIRRMSEKSWEKLSKIITESFAYKKWYAQKDAEYRRKADKMGENWKRQHGYTLQENYNSRYGKVYGQENLDAKVKEEMICDFVAEKLFGNRAEVNLRRMLDDMNPSQRRSFKTLIEDLIAKLKDIFGRTDEIHNLEKAWGRAWAEAQANSETKNTRPDIDRTDVVFAKGEVSYSISFESISKENKNNAKLRGDVVLETEGGLLNAISESVQNGNLQNNYIISSIPNDVKQKISSQVGSDIFKSGEYVFKISSDDIRHIKKHFNNEEKIIKAIYRLYDTVCKYDSVELLTEKNGRKKLKFEKSYDDFDYLSMEIASKKTRALDLITFYITKNNKIREDKIQSRVRSENLTAPGVSSSNFIVSTSSENVNKNVSTNNGKISLPSTDSKQIKDTDNLKAAAKNDIRYSMPDDVDNFNAYDYNEIGISKSEKNSLLSDAMTWHADKVGKLFEIRKSGYVYNCIFDEYHELYVFGKKRSVNIHDVKEQNRNDRLANDFDKGLVLSRNGRRDGLRSDIISRNGRTTAEDEGISDREISGTQQSKRGRSFESNDNIDGDKEADGLTPAFSIPENKYSVPNTLDSLLDEYEDGKISKEEYLTQLNAFYDEKKKGGVIGQGENPAEDSLEVPESVSKGKKVERYARTVGEVEGLSEDAKDELKVGILQGKYDYVPISNEKLIEKAENPVEIANMTGEDADTTPPLKRRHGESNGDKTSNTYESLLESDIFDDKFKDEVKADGVIDNGISVYYTYKEGIRYYIK